MSVSGGGFTASGFSPTTVAPGGSTSFKRRVQPAGRRHVFRDGLDQQQRHADAELHLWRARFGRQAPIAVNDTGYGVLHDHTLTVAASGILANDTDPQGYALTASVATGPAHGTLSLNSNGGFRTTRRMPTGPAQIAIRTWRTTDICTASRRVWAIVVGDNAPTGYADGYIVRENTALDVPVTGSPYSGVLANDTDPDGDTPLQAVLVAGPAHGTLSLNAMARSRIRPITGTPAPTASSTSRGMA